MIDFKDSKMQASDIFSDMDFGEGMNIKLSRRLLKVRERRYGRMPGVDLIKAHSLTPGNARENETNFVVQLIHF